MTDVFDQKTRSRIMSKIRSKDTKPEMIVRRFLHSRGFRYRLHVQDMPGKPDIVLPKYKAVIFVHGCFWHRHEGCKRANKPSTNTEYWDKKISRNIARDRQHQEALLSAGWRVLIIWECSLSTIAKREHNLKLLPEWLLTSNYTEKSI